MAEAVRAKQHKRKVKTNQRHNVEPSPELTALDDSDFGQVTSSRSGTDHVGKDNINIENAQVEEGQDENTELGISVQESESKRHLEQISEQITAAKIKPPGNLPLGNDLAGANITSIVSPSTTDVTRGIAVEEDPETPMSRATSPAASRTVFEGSKSPISPVGEPVVIEEKNPHLLAAEAFARMQALASNLKVTEEPIENSDHIPEASSSLVKSEVPIEKSAPDLKLIYPEIQEKAESTISSSQQEKQNMLMDKKKQLENEKVETGKVKATTQFEVPKTKISAMSLSQLQEIYHNPQLAVNEQFVEDFIRNEMKKESHEFYEILSSYLCARLKLVAVEEEIKLLQTNYNSLQESVWITTTKTILAQGECADKHKVNAAHRYEQCQKDPDALNQLKIVLKNIGNQITEYLSLFSYSAMISKLQVESYIHELYTQSPLLRDIPKNTPVEAVKQYQTDQDRVFQINKLKDCISILFMFHRKPNTDPEFVNNIRSWTSRLVSSLLRVATFRDHLFVLNHLLRCPAGVGQWASDLIQFTKISPPGGHTRSSFANDILDHVITALSTVLLPVKAREDFLAQMRISLTQESIQDEKMWILVDLDGEEDEDPANAWLYLHENDIVAFLNQFSLSDLFSHILLSSVSDSGHVDYDIRRCSEPMMVKLFSFSTVLVQLLGSGLATFNMVRYRQLNKRIGRLIRHTVCFVSDHWLNFKTHFGPMTTNTSMEMLQTEFDQLFMRATYCFLTAQKLGSWQFMADMPYTCVSKGSMWQLLWILHQGQGHVVNVESLPPAEECKEYVQNPDSWQQLADNLTHMPTSEAFFLMTTFANMACFRSYSEQDFVQTITNEVFEIAYISTHTRGFCSKVGRELLASIIQTHPSALSFLLARVKEVLSKLGKMALYLFSELPISIWQPTDPDLLILRQWLLNFGISFVENELACTILSKINWDVFEQTGQPVVDFRIHRQMALMLVEAYTKFISDKKAGFFITEGMKQMAFYVTCTQSHEQIFNNWAWNLALKLKLHQQSVIWHSASGAVDANFVAPDLAKESWLLPLLKGTTNKVPIACYIALAMTNVGHDVTFIMRDGLDLLNQLTLIGQYTSAIHILGCIVPLFLQSQQYLLDSESFQGILQSLVMADESLLKSTKSTLMTVEFPGLVIKQLNEMIQAQISCHLAEGKADLLLTFWTKGLYRVSQFFADRNCCYVINSLIQWCFVKTGVTDIFMKLVKEFYLQYHAACKDHRNMMSAMLSWISSSPNVSPSFMDSASIQEFPWLAFLVMTVEKEREIESGLWHTLQTNLQHNRQMNVESALKNAVSHLQLQQAPTTHRLSIYRWAKQCLDTPIDHPLLPILWQNFFMLYLGRQATQSSMAQRASVGERFFESLSYSGMLKKMTKRLREASDYHLNFDPATFLRLQGPKALSQSADQRGETSPVSAGDGGSSPSSPEAGGNAAYISTKEFHQMLSRLYQTFILWLEEPRLHDANLFLPALPPQYEANRLNQVFQGYTSPWLEFMDTEGLQYTLSCLAASWRTCLARDKLPNLAMSDRLKMDGYENATKRIVQRLKRYDFPKDPPALVKIQSSVPLISSTIVEDKDAFFQLVTSDLELLRQHTLIFSAKTANHSALDDAYIQLLPSLYTNAPKLVYLSAECRSHMNPLHACSGPAQLGVRINEKERNEITFRRIQENRVEYKQLLIEQLIPTPLNVCVACVHTENAITLLIKLCQKSVNASLSQRLRDIGCCLFFHLTSLVSEETNFYSPAKHFLASCIEILGQEFVSRDASQTETVLQLCLDKPLVAGLVSPHFVPTMCPNRLVNMYGQLIHVLQAQNTDLVFMLLTKFDIPLWLEKDRPSEQERKRLVEILGSSLTACGADLEANSSLVFGLYVSHLKALLQSSFPLNLTTILNMILQGSSSQGLHVQVWEAFLAVCFSSDPPNCLPFNASSIEACQEVVLSTIQVKEFIDWMGSYFMHARLEMCQNSGQGLYARWAHYVYYISLFVGGLVRSYAFKVLRSSGDTCNPFELLNTLWGVYAPWIQPMVGDNEALNTPWLEQDTLAASNMICSLSHTLKFVYEKFSENNPSCASGMLSLILMYYLSVLSTKNTPPYAMNAYLHTLQDIHWHTLWPDLQLVEAMAKVKENASPCCFSLVGFIMPFVKWDLVNNYHINHTPPEIASRMQTSIAVLLIQCYVDPDMLERENIYHLLVEAESFNWSTINLEGITCVTNWFLQLSNPACVSVERSSTLAIGLRLLKQMCGFTCLTQWHQGLISKRHMYVHMATQQVCQLTYRQDVQPKAVDTVLVNLMSEIEAVETSVPSVEGQEEESAAMMKSVFGLLNNSNPESSWMDSILSTLTGWLLSSPQSILLAPCMKAASRSLASLRHMSAVMEACITSYFSGLTDPSVPGSKGWDFILSIFHIPELNQGEFVQEALVESAFLVLYAYLRLKAPFCQTPDQSFALIEDILSMTVKALPSEQNESKILLWWHLLFDLLSQQIRASPGSKVSVMSVVHRFIPSLNTLGQERNQKGLLGAIGLGQKSPLSKKMRLMSVVFSGYLQSQLIANDLRIDSSLPLPVSLTKELRNIRVAKSYASLSAACDKAIVFMRDPSHSIMETPKFISMISLELFPDQIYLNHVFA